MFVYSSGRGYRARFNGGGGIGCLIFGIIGMVAAFFILKGLFTLLYWASPVLFVLALVINWRAVVDTLKNWLKTMETNPVGGLLIAALAVLLFPVFALYLFVKSLGYRKIEQMQREFRANEPSAGEFAEFEELESTPKGGAKEEAPMEPLVLPDKEPEPESSKKQKLQDKGQQAKAGSKKNEPQPSHPDEAQKPDNPYDKLFE
ncbi:MAG: hypothetical protein DYG98_09580 [Haliscomenobacteraceae bacterium CHB4]|nr:hypothetical protein [Saprospiraceae bacterium]MCE7923297.1 hypothetical protein [Haliscomenobacteraceae bacterium CHB4]